MDNHAIEINGDTKIATLLDAYPELEETLIAMAPPFKKLRNPILRRSVAKVASLRQSAAVGRLPFAEMVNALRSAVGLEPIDNKTDEAIHDYFGAQPGWFDDSKIVARLSEESDFDELRMPITNIVKHCNELRDGEILEVRAAFLPAPAIDLMERRRPVVIEIAAEHAAAGDEHHAHLTRGRWVARFRIDDQDVNTGDRSAQRAAVVYTWKRAEDQR